MTTRKTKRSKRTVWLSAVSARALTRLDKRLARDCAALGARHHALRQENLELLAKIAEAREALAKRDEAHQAAIQTMRDGFHRKKPFSLWNRANLVNAQRAHLTAARADIEQSRTFLRMAWKRWRREYIGLWRARWHDWRLRRRGEL